MVGTGLVVSVGMMIDSKVCDRGVSRGDEEGDEETEEVAGWMRWWCFRQLSHSLFPLSSLQAASFFTNRQARGKESTAHTSLSPLVEVCGFRLGYCCCPAVSAIADGSLGSRLDEVKSRIGEGLLQQDMSGVDGSSDEFVMVNLIKTR